MATIDMPLGAVAPINQAPAPQVRQAIASAIAIFRYDVPYTDDCAFEKGDEIFIFEIISHDWWRGLNIRTGREGYFPSGRVKITKGSMGMGILARVHALYDYTARQQEELSFLAGQELILTELTSNDWWKGKLAHSDQPEGYIPRNFIFIHENAPPPPSVLENQEGGDVAYYAYGFMKYKQALHVGLAFKQGDELSVTAELSDTLSWGTNTTTHAHGVFPHACVIYDFQANDSGDASSLVDKAGNPTFTARALQDFDGNISADLSFHKGESIEVKHVLNYDILWGKNKKTGAEGLFLAEFSRRARGYSDRAPYRTGAFATVLRNWQGQSEGQLSITKGDRILLIDDGGVGWWNGRNEKTGGTGVFPGQHVLLPEARSPGKSPAPVDVLNSKRPQPANLTIPSPQEISRISHQPVPNQLCQLAGQPETTTEVPPTPPFEVPLPPSFMASGSRLDTNTVRDAKLNTSFIEKDVVCHTWYSSNSKRRFDRAILEEKWKLQRQLGQGSLGRVDLQECVDGKKKGKVRAVKVITKHPAEDDAENIDYGRELEAIAKFSGDKYTASFVQSQGWYENENAIFITMEYLPHGDLGKHMKGRFPECEVGLILSQLMEGLSYMHDNGFAHRDLKPSNILVRETSPNWWVKLGDFGLTKRAQGDVIQFIGASPYLAPEAMGILRQNERENIDPTTMRFAVAVDQWALGAIAFRLLTTRDSFPDVDSLRSYVNGRVEFPADVLQTSRISLPCVDFLRGVLNPAPTRRPEASLALTHPWLEEISSSFPFIV